MKRWINSFLVWNLLLTVAIGSCVYSLKDHLTKISMCATNIYDLVKLANKLNEQQEKITDILNVAMATGSIPNVETIPGLPGVIQKGIICDKELTPEQIEKLILKTMPKSAQLPMETQTHQIEYKFPTYPVIFPPERK